MGDQVDGYWLRLGHLGVDVLQTHGITRELSPAQVGETAEWLGRLLSEAHDMGMRMAELRATFGTKD